jgi:hypothetical protein
VAVEVAAVGEVLVVPAGERVYRVTWRSAVEEYCSAVDMIQQLRITKVAEVVPTNV